nr:chemotaxis protein CheW [Massilia sp. TS11]
MDRNLYERANDCRWWALSTAFRQALADGRPDAARRAELSRILAYINRLYSVYTNLLLFDASGRVVAVSQDSAAELVGQRLEAPWVARTLALRHPQEYVVSDFEASPLYGGAPTYVYAAAVQAPDASAVVGGIAIVFDSAPQFSGILHDILPRAGGFALFADEQGRVIASSDGRYAPGHCLPPALLRTGAPPAALVHVAELDGTLYAIGQAESCGYREYKGPDDVYRNPVRAFVFQPLCAARAASAAPQPALALRGDRARAGGDTREIATLRIGANWYGLASADVVEAVERQPMVSIKSEAGVMQGYRMIDKTPVPVFFLGTAHDEASAAQQIVILRHPEQGRFGILVDELGAIADVDVARLKPLPAEISWGRNVMTESVLMLNQSAQPGLLQVMSAARIFTWLTMACPEAATPPALTAAMLAEYA